MQFVGLRPELISIQQPLIGLRVKLIPLREQYISMSAAMSALKWGSDFARHVIGHHWLPFLV
jgi:hypothetical protein